MFRRTKRIAAMFVMIAVIAAAALTGCMPAATTGGTEGSGSATGGLMGFLPLILIVVVFYFLLIRPQNKKNKQVNEMRSALKRGDWVTTIGGFRGRVTRVKDDLITIEVGTDKTKMDIMRWGISKIDEAAPESVSERDADGEAEEAPKRKPRKLTPVAKKESVSEEDEAADDEE